MAQPARKLKPATERRMRPRLRVARPAPLMPPPFGTPTGVARVSRVALQHIRDHRGDLVVAELGHHLPFLCRRMYALVNVPAGAERGGHSHRDLEQVLVVLSGRLTLTVDDGVRREAIELDGDADAVYLRPMVWRELSDFEPNTVCVVLASDGYDEADYIRTYDVFSNELDARGLR